MDVVCLLFSYLQHSTSWINGFVKGMSLPIIWDCHHLWMTLCWKTSIIRSRRLLSSSWSMGIGCWAMNKCSTTNGTTSRTVHHWCFQNTILSTRLTTPAQSFRRLYMLLSFCSSKSSLGIGYRSGAFQCHRERLKLMRTFLISSRLLRWLVLKSLFVSIRTWRRITDTKPLTPTP